MALGNQMDVIGHDCAGIHHEFKDRDDLFKPAGDAGALRVSSVTAGKISACFAACRVARSCGLFARERRDVVFVAGPKRLRCDAHTSVDHEPRPSFGSQNPWHAKIEWCAITMRQNLPTARDRAQAFRV
jgi:hypothetical protein